MRYSILSSTVALLLGSVAIAGAEPEPETATTTTKPETMQVFFETDSAAVADSAELKPLADWAKCNRKDAIILEGRADPRGTNEYNAELSAKRAAAVREELITMGVKPSQIMLEIYGETDADSENLAHDRRVTARLAAGELNVPTGG